MLVVACVAVHPAAAQDRKLANDLKQIGLAYHNYNDATNKAPSKAEDLGPYLEMNKRLIDMLKNGDVVFIWDVPLKQIVNMGAGTSNTVLAYEKDAPTKGGYVLMADASVKKLAADEFKKATLAKKQ